MEILIIVVHDCPDMGRIVWENVKKKYTLEDSIKFHEISISEGKILIVVKQSDTSQQTQNSIIESLKKKEITELCISTHEKDLHRDVIAENLKIDINKINLRSYHNISQTEHYDIIVRLIESLCTDQIIKQNINKYFDDLWNFIKKHIPLNYLIALSILCQGYLAAHCVEGFKVNDNGLQQKAVTNKGKTKERSWWKPALGKDYESVDLNKELQDRNKKNDIECLIEIINDKKDVNGTKYFVNGDNKDAHTLNNTIIEDFTGKVYQANEQIKGILNPK